MAPSDDEELPDLTYYNGTYYEKCQELNKMEMKEEYDDYDYIYEDADFVNNNTLKLHDIYYRRKVCENGVSCSKIPKFL
ncbi:unnamed protein product [Linum trigynum]|uniref:Uncharacterized protein n=1 Tax=Linum trigynum TaxID=586398 RepID=A0AAV2FN24_9ROSI